MRRIVPLALLSAVAAPLAYPGAAFSQPAIPAFVTAAVANAARPAADRAVDVERKPAETLAFTGVKPGDVVVDVLPGAGYFTQLFCGVVGPAGQVVQLKLTPAPDPNALKGGAMKMMAMTSNAHPAAPAPICANVTRLSQPVTAISLPAPADVIFTSRNYHDLHNAMFGKPDMLAVDKAIFAALKPGGVFVVLDHADAAGSGTRDTDTLHRIDPASVRAEVTAAGFSYAGSSDALANPADDHSKKVFDPLIRGRTDQFILKFRKPA